MNPIVRSTLKRGGALVALAMALSLLVAVGYFTGSGAAHRYAVDCRPAAEDPCRVLMAAAGFHLPVAHGVREFPDMSGLCTEYRKA